MATITGWGQHTWGADAWGQTGEPVPAAGGWGSAGFGEGPWGEGVTYSLSVDVGSVVAGISINANVDGQQITSTLDNVSIQGNASVLVQGQLLSSNLGNADLFGNASVDLTGIQLTTVLDNVGISADGNIQVPAPAETEMTASVNDASVVIEVGPIIDQTEQLTANLGTVNIIGTGNVEVSGELISAVLDDVVAKPNTIAVVTGFGTTITLGNTDQIGTATVTLTGLAISANLGTVDAVSVVDVTGNALTLAQNSVSITANASVTPTGLSFNANLGSVQTLDWEVVDVGTSVSYTIVNVA